MTLIEKIKPGISQRGLFLIAGIVWTIGGLMLMTRGTIGIFAEGKHILIDVIIGFGLGILFYIIMFSSISDKHLKRMKGITIEKPCMFSFFNRRSYILMAIMITAGITLRKLDIINHQVLFTFYLMMGLPLFVSAIRFYRAWWRFGL
jgi:hypothetical protein